jgi:hypothetical protein
VAQVLVPLLDPSAPQVDDHSGHGDLRTHLAWSLARMTTLRHDASALVVDALGRAATLADGPTSRATAAYAIRALAVLPAHEAGNALRRASEGTCDAPIAPWPATLGDWPVSDTEANAHSTMCWAQAALSERTRSFGEDNLRLVR